MATDVDRVASGVVLCRLHLYFSFCFFSSPTSLLLLQHRHLQFVLSFLAPPEWQPIPTATRRGDSGYSYEFRVVPGPDPNGRICLSHFLQSNIKPVYPNIIFLCRWRFLDLFFSKVAVRSSSLYEGLRSSLGSGPLGGPDAVHQS